MTPSTTTQQSIQDEIADLERRLQDAKARLNGDSAVVTGNPAPVNDAALHALLLLADSALPLGSFAFSSGLESFLAHQKASAVNPPSSSTPTPYHAFQHFLHLSLSTLATTALPYVLAGYRNPQDIEDLDNDFDASTPCTVARRASTAQGQALVAVWERSYRGEYGKDNVNGGKEMGVNGVNGVANGIIGTASGSDMHSDTDAIALEALASFSRTLRTSTSLNAHYAPLWGLVTRVLHIPLHDAAYLFLFSHARTVVSAAVRASVMGPYQAQSVLASSELQNRIRKLVEDGWGRSTQDAGQSVPVMDLWVGRHEVLYSRIFNS